MCSGIICREHNDDETDTLPTRMVLIRFFYFIKFANLAIKNVIEYDIRQVQVE